MNIEFLRNFTVLAQTKNFSKAAEQLYISQPALTKQIRHMEEELGYQLVERTTKKCNLTENGVIFLKYAQSICDLYEQMKDELKVENTKRYRSLKIGYVTTAHRQYVEKALQALCVSFPELDVSVVHDLPKNLLQQMEQKRLDCALMQLPSVEGEKGFMYSTLVAGGVAARISEKNPLSQKKMISLRDLADETLLMSEITCMKCNAYINEGFASAGITPHWSVVNSLESVELLTLARNRISFTSEYNPVIPGLVKVPVQELQKGFDIVFVQEEENQNPYIRKLFDLMKRDL